MKKETSYLMPFLAMVFLFLIVGFLTTANTQFQAPLQRVFLSDAGALRNTFATLITFSWFLAYPVFGPAGSHLVGSKGYKGTLLRGLILMACGLLLFFLSSVLAAKAPEMKISLGSAGVHPGFIVFLLGSFITGGSATVLQVVINPYLSACTVRGTQSIQRLAIGGTANSIGTTIAPYFVSGIVFGGVAVDSVSVDSTMVPFFCLVAVIVLLTLLMSKFSLPDIEGTRNEGNAKLERSIWSFRHLTLGVVAIFFYVGCEVCIGGNINFYAIEKGIASPALLATVYWGAMLAGRSLGSFLSRISPRTQLIATTSAAIILVSAAIIADSPWLLAFVGLAHSIMWGAIFTLATSGLGRYTSIASGVFMIGVVGGAVLPLLQGIVADASGMWRSTWYIVLAGEVIMLLYAVYGSRIRKGDLISE